MSIRAHIEAYAASFLLLLFVALCIILSVLLIFSPNIAGTIGYLGWYSFAFISGLSMIALSSILPFAFVIVPLAMGRKALRGIGMTVAFAIGMAIMLSLYGVVTAQLGRGALQLMGVHFDTLRNWIYIISGTFVYIFALSEIGLLRLHFPSHTGFAPHLIRKQKGYATAFLLGLFLGNIGVGVAQPATILLLVESASSGNVFYGWSLFFVHALGRALPLVLLAVLGVLGWNGLGYIAERKERIERMNGWFMVAVAGFIVTLGVFGNMWWSQSAEYGAVTTLVSQVVGTETVMKLAPPMMSVSSAGGVFGQSLAWGEYLLLLLWLLPLWIHYVIERRRVYGAPILRLKKLEASYDRLDAERKGIEMMLHIPDGAHSARYLEVLKRIEVLEKERRVIEEAIRYGVAGKLWSTEIHALEVGALRLRRNGYLLFCVVICALFLWIFPLQQARSCSPFVEKESPSNFAVGASCEPSFDRF